MSSHFRSIGLHLDLLQFSPFLSISVGSRVFYCIAWAIYDIALSIYGSYISNTIFLLWWLYRNHKDNFLVWRTCIPFPMRCTGFFLTCFADFGLKIGLLRMLNWKYTTSTQAIFMFLWSRSTLFRWCLYCLKCVGWNRSDSSRLTGICVPNGLYLVRGLDLFSLRRDLWLCVIYSLRVFLLFVIILWAFIENMQLSLLFI